MCNVSLESLNKPTLPTVEMSPNEIEFQWYDDSAAFKVFHVRRFDCPALVMRMYVLFSTAKSQVLPEFD
jgi:hypothetical protein